MTKYKHIVVSGDVGTGTTTLSKSLAEKLGWQYLSAGDFFRAYHKEHHIPLWNKAAIPDDVEKKIDYELAEKMKTEKEIVFDGHYAGWFAKDKPDIFKILLTCDQEVATQRILARNHTHKETTEEIDKRREQIREKFQKLYSKDNYEDPNFFDLVIDTTKTDPRTTLATSLSKFSQGY